MADNEPRLIDPFMSFRFKVELDGIISGGFSDVSGLSAETEIQTVKEGGENTFEYKLPKTTKYQNLILKRGLSDDRLWDWYEEVIHGRIKRKEISVILINETGEYVARWNFKKAFPVKWEGPALSARSAAVAVESLTVVHEWMYK